MQRNSIVFLTLIYSITCIKVLPVLHKCCANNQLVISKRKCINSTDVLDFSQFPIFSEELKKTEMKIYDSFNIETGRFQDTTFRNKSLYFSAISTHKKSWFNLYLTEKAQLFLEVPNMYDRWFEEKNFCFDLLKTRSRVKPVFYCKEEPMNEVQDDMNNENFFAHIRSHRVLKNQRIAENVNFIVILVSCCFLLSVLIVYASLPELRNLSGLLLMTFVASILVALLQLDAMRVLELYDNACFSMTLSIYFFSLASFCWMNVMAFDVWWMLRKTKDRSNYRRREILTYGMYSIYAWSLPLALTLMLVWVDSMDLTHMPWIVKPNILLSGCFISGGEKFLYIDVPLLILISINWILHVMTAINIRATIQLHSTIDVTSTIYHEHQKRFYLYLKLTIMMTINCIFKVMKFAVPDVRTWYLNVASNTLIGISVFLIFVYKRKIMGRFCKTY